MSALPLSSSMSRNRRSRAERAAANVGAQIPAPALPDRVTCAVCGALHAQQARRARGAGDAGAEVVLVPAHAAAHDGWNTEAGGDCAGTNYPPMEVTPQAARDLLERKDAALAAYAERLERLSRADVHSVTDLKGWWGVRGAVVSIGDPRFERAVQLERTDLEMTCAGLQTDIALLQSRLRNWLLGDPARELPAPRVRTGYSRLNRNPVKAVLEEVDAARREATGWTRTGRRAG